MVKEKATQIKITLIKSTISCKEKQIKTVEALGLTKINTFNIVNDNPCIRGMIKVVNHLVKIENV